MLHRVVFYLALWFTVAPAVVAFTVTSLGWDDGGMPKWLATSERWQVIALALVCPLVLLSAGLGWMWRRRATAAKRVLEALRNAK